MKILIVGGTGTIGQALSAHLQTRHDVIRAGRTRGELQVDLTDSASIEALYAATGALDAVVCLAGESKWAPFADLSEADFWIGLRHKLMGQVNLVRLGQSVLNPGGSFTLTSGILADYPEYMTSSAALVNGGLHSFVKAVSRELKPGLRINIVSPGLVEASVAKYAEYFPGHNPIPMAKVINAYVRSLEGRGSGEILRVYDRDDRSLP